MLQVVLFSGGRGSSVLSNELVRDPRVRLTIAINGYDDGASTGEVRRLLGDSLGPSDFRKNASRLAAGLNSAPPALLDALDSRLPRGIERQAAIERLRAVQDRLDGPHRTAVAARLDAFLSELAASGRPFDFSDCSVGNLVFAGGFLMAGRRFNPAVDDYCALVGLAPGVVDDVTDGTNAFLVAVGSDGSILGSEEEIVDANRSNRIDDIFLIDRPLGVEDRARLSAAGPEAAVAFFNERQVVPRLNPRLAERIAAADLIVYAPGTQHSSLFPSYVTPGLSAAIAGNLRAIKLLITNIQSDAEIAGSTAVEIIERAVYYLKEKGTRRTPTPCLITHYIVNDPARAEAPAPYVPLGHLDAIEDPRLVRVANYEEGVTGRHDAAKILGPFVRSFLEPRQQQRLGVLLHDAGSPDKVTQTLLEMVRGGIQELPVDVAVFYRGEPLEASFVASLPFTVHALGSDAERRFREAVRDAGADYVLLFESSGMYRGEDIVTIASHLSVGRLDAAWGSRRLSVRDIQESLRLRYRHHAMLRAVSYGGSHVLSLACLLLYGRYISDTLSAVRAVRTADALAIDVPLTHKRANQHLLAALLRRRAEILEIPVQFFPISPERVKRTSVVEGLQALGALVLGRFRMAHADRRWEAAPPAPRVDERRSDPVVPR
ncbi:MAG: 2-phospho-L-lactate transferase CofD family protein [Betaproteobacteria bacterium]